MSCYMVEESHVVYLASAAAAMGVRWRDRSGNFLRIKPGAEPNHIRHVAQMLWNQNLKSVVHLYGSSPETKRSNYKVGHISVPIDFSWPQVLKSVHCLEYQSNETDRYETTEAYRLLMAIGAAAMKLILNGVPEYENAIWGAPK